MNQLLLLGPPQPMRRQNAVVPRRVPHQNLNNMTSEMIISQTNAVLQNAFGDDEMTEDEPDGIKFDFTTSRNEKSGDLR